MKKIISVVGARPNFMKVAPLHLEFKKFKEIKHLICHTGQHYDEKMSRIFFEELGLPKPDFYLGIGSGSHAVQTAGIMVEFEKVLIKENPDLVIVVGDVNSTLACSLVAKKMHVRVAHVEAGLRSFDNEMPEEINRLMTDAIADFLFVPEESGMNNLQKEGVDASRTFFVGNIMIDSLINNASQIASSKILEEFGLVPSGYLLATLHRPSNVDQPESLSDLIRILNKYSNEHKVIFPMHPRTRSNMIKMNLMDGLSPNLVLCDPIGYIDFLCLIKNARLIITDSGGIQEESTFLGVQCITLRANTERPVTVQLGTNQLIGTAIPKIDQAIADVLNGKMKKGSIPPLWDGKTAERICSILVEKINEN